MRRPIVFVTDYGTDDAYAAALTGAVWRVEPRTVCVNGTHGVPPGDVLAGAYHVKSLALAFDREVVICAVVDPGVGTARRAIAADIGGVVCVAPDNGLISYLWDEAPADGRWAVTLETPPFASSTFHGRDLFAPVAAQLAAGATLDDVGEPINDPLLVEAAFASSELGVLRGRVAVVDHFGNAITTVRVRDVGSFGIAAVRWAGGATQRVVSTYAAIVDRVAALFGSAGHLEIAAGGDAAGSHGAPQRGDEITVELR